MRGAWVWWGGTHESGFLYNSPPPQAVLESSHTGDRCVEVPSDCPQAHAPHRLRFCWAQLGTKGCPGPRGSVAPSIPSRPLDGQQTAASEQSSSEGLGNIRWLWVPAQNLPGGTDVQPGSFPRGFCVTVCLAHGHMCCWRTRCSRCLARPLITVSLPPPARSVAPPSPVPASRGLAGKGSWPEPRCRGPPGQEGPPRRTGPGRSAA